jgi:hypothetical protein
MSRRLIAVVAIVVLIGAASVGWRWAVQRVNVVIVNASGQVGQFSWQPQLFGNIVDVPVGGCESKSIELLAGETWRFTSDRIEVTSSVVSVPLLAQEVAFELWLAADGTSRLVPAYVVDGPMSAPAPPCVTNS